jgi:hypothetical protein
MSKEIEKKKKREKKCKETSKDDKNKSLLLVNSGL